MTQHDAALPKRLKAVTEQPTQQSMRGDRKITKNPSTDQKKIRHELKRKTAAEPVKVECKMCGHVSEPVLQDTGAMGCRRCDSPNVVKVKPAKPYPWVARKTATELPVNADKLNPGDFVRGPNNQVVKVRQVRNHKSDANQVYVDTEAGTIAVPRVQQFTMVPGGQVNRQQELAPGIGLPGGNSNQLPGAPNAGGMDPGASHGTHKCPIDGASMQLHNQGGVSMWVCPQDGYSMNSANFGMGGGGTGVTTSPDAMNSLSFLSHLLVAHQGDDDYLHVHDPSNSNMFTYMSHGEEEDPSLNAHIHNDHDPFYKNDHDTGDHDPSHFQKPNYPTHIHNQPSEPYDQDKDHGHYHGALDAGPANECKLCGGRVRTDAGQDAGKGQFTASCEDCGTQHQIQKKVRTASWIGKPCEECGGPKDDRDESGSYNPLCNRCWKQEAYQHAVGMGMHGESDDVSWAAEPLREHIRRGIEDGRASRPTKQSSLKRTAAFDEGPIDECQVCGEPQYDYALRGGKDWIRCSNGHAYPADPKNRYFHVPDNRPHPRNPEPEDRQFEKSEGHHGDEGSDESPYHASKYSPPKMSAIARRAQHVLDQKEQ